ncbi:MAG: hypothetical protein ACI97A_003988 [Planctomycetota bacterium]|jgi:hypothetical protein
MIGTSAVLLTLALLFLFTGVFHGSCGDLSGLASGDDDWTIHATNPAEIVSNPRMRQLFQEMATSPEWRQLLGFATESSSSNPEEIIKLVDEIIEEWAAGEVFVSVRWSDDQIRRTVNTMGVASNPRPFESITCVFRPRSSRLLAMARVASVPVVRDRLLASFIPANAGAEMLNGVLQIANPGSLSGNPAEKTPMINGLAATTIRDVIIVGTSYEQVVAKREMLADLDEFPQASSPHEAHLEISSHGIRKLGESFTDLFGLRSTHFVRALHGTKPIERLKINLNVGEQIHLTAEWAGTPWAARPMAEFQPGRDSLQLSLTPADFATRIGLDLIDNFDANEVCRNQGLLLDEESQKRPILQSWLTKEKIKALAKELEDAQADRLEITWASPKATSTEDRPIIAVSCTTMNSQTLKQSAASLGLLFQGGQLLRPIQLPSLAGFFGLEQPHGASTTKKFLVTNGPSPIALEKMPELLPLGSPALWRFQTTGKSLASLLHSLDEIRAKEIDRPTFSRRLAMFRKFQQGKEELDLDLDVVTKITDELFKSNKEKALTLLRNREKAYGSMLRNFAEIRCEGRVKGDSTIVEFAIE